jgi:hypothetical protein
MHPKSARRSQVPCNGVTPAGPLPKKVQPAVSYIFVPVKFETEDAMLKTSSPGIYPSIGVLAPNSQYKTVVDSPRAYEEIDKSRISGDWYTYVWGQITYDDVFKQHHKTEFCVYRQGSTADFVQCPFHNDAD